MSKNRKKQQNNIANSKGDVKNNFGLENGMMPSVYRGVKTRSILSQLSTEELLTNNYTLISLLREKDWVANKIVSLPVDDAFKDLPKIITKLATNEETHEVLRLFQKKFLPAFKDFCCTVRAFGTAGLIIDTKKNKGTLPLQPAELFENENVEVYASDMMSLIQHNNSGFQNPKYKNFIYGGQDLTKVGENLNEEKMYYMMGEYLHRTRVLRLDRNSPDLYIARRLAIKGGTSIFESILNAFDRNSIIQALSIELLEESKLDIIKMDGLTANQSSPDFATSLQNTLQSKMDGKNYNSTLILDRMTTDYEQKQLNLTILPTLLQFSEEALFRASGIPPKRLAGLHSSGFSDSDKTVEENYRSDLKMLQSWGYNQYLDLIKICFFIKYGEAPEDLELEFPPLDTPSAEVQQSMKNQALDNIDKLVRMVDLSPNTVAKLINEAKIFDIELPVSSLKNTFNNFNA
jgi:phage-related protein (TIGR01555 family)